MVVAGKRSDFTERTYRLIREEKSHNKHFIHYDNLMDSCDCISHLESATHFTTKPATLKEWRFHRQIQFFSSSLH